jgi:uncharacterized protein YciI
VPHFVATYAYTDDTTTRDAVRPAHREYLGSLDALLLSGPTDADGALLVFEAGSADEVEALLDADPFAVHGGIVASRTVVGWQVVLGSAKDRL